MSLRCMFRHVRGQCVADSGEESPYCRPHSIASHIGALEEDVEDLGGKVVLLHVSEEELKGALDWIREGDSPETIGRITTLLKRIVGGG